MSGGREDWTSEDGCELRFLESLHRRCPDNIHLLRALGDLYTRGGRIQEGLKVDLQLAKFCKTESEVWYNLGCSYSLNGDYDGAFEALYKALELGYSDAEWVERDSDLEAIREDPRYPLLVQRMRKVEQN